MTALTPPNSAQLRPDLRELDTPAKLRPRPTGRGEVRGEVPGAEIQTPNLAQLRPTATCGTSA